MTPKQHIYISPHFDDAVLSCGGHIAQQIAAGQSVLVATVFGGIPDRPELSPFAQEIHARPNAGARPMEARRLEDRKAVAILGATPRHGDELDAIYRMDRKRTRWLYDSETAIFGPIDPEEAAEPLWLAQSIATLAPARDQCRFYLPLAIGNHVDHQLLRRAGEILLTEGFQAWFYEDYPYVVRSQANRERARSWRRRRKLQPKIASLDAASLAKKGEAIQAYASQLGMLFPDGTEVPSALEAFARQVARQAGLQGYAERYWRARGRPRER